MKAVLGIGSVVIMLFLAAGPRPVLAQQGPGGGQGPMMQGGQRQQADPATFSERKARVQKLLEERKTRLEQEKTCVDAAKNDDDLAKCRPQRPMMQGSQGMQGGRGGMGGPGMQRPPMGDMSNPQ